MIDPGDGPSGAGPPAGREDPAASAGQGQGIDLVDGDPLADGRLTALDEAPAQAFHHRFDVGVEERQLRLDAPEVDAQPTRGGEWEEGCHGLEHPLATSGVKDSVA